MKNQRHFKPIALSLLSGGILALFLLIATGSLDDLFYVYGFTQTLDYSEEDKTYTRDTENANTYNEYTGPRDPQGRWDGPVTIVHGDIVNESGDREVFSTECSL